jgi:hypothetical protein
MTLDKWALGEPEIVMQVELDEGLLLDLALDGRAGDYDMSPEVVRQCLEQGMTFQASPFCYRRVGAGSMWLARLRAAGTGLNGL